MLVKTGLIDANVLVYPMDANLPTQAAEGNSPYERGLPGDPPRSRRSAIFAVSEHGVTGESDRPFARRLAKAVALSPGETHRFSPAASLAKFVTWG
jgi:hypothetical protein